MAEESVFEVLVDIPESGVLIHDPSVCVGCGVCGLMCSLYHEGVQGPALARIQVVRDPFSTVNVRLRIPLNGWKEGKRVAIKCNLCRNREAGPICVDYCTSGALKYIPKSGR
jgi:Fe-S-cluster-containing hydrogenase component 2